MKKITFALIVSFALASCEGFGKDEYDLFLDDYQAVIEDYEALVDRDSLCMSDFMKASADAGSKMAQLGERGRAVIQSGKKPSEAQLARQAQLDALSKGFVTRLMTKSGSVDATC